MTSPNPWLPMYQTQAFRSEARHAGGHAPSCCVGNSFLLLETSSGHIKHRLLFGWLWEISLLAQILCIPSSPVFS
jgi:hypothetical protein